ncbi:hypothetical protein OPQ81_010626 [Rhizoctonia solani]|nr:hypothetical protein OPQ81_010626 [Rhizoctonia solani]
MKLQWLRPGLPRLAPLGILNVASTHGLVQTGLLIDIGFDIRVRRTTRVLVLIGSGSPKRNVTSVMLNGSRGHPLSPQRSMKHLGPIGGLVAGSQQSLAEGSMTVLNNTIRLLVICSNSDLVDQVPLEQVLDSPFELRPIISHDFGHCTPSSEDIFPEESSHGLCIDPPQALPLDITA